MTMIIVSNWILTFCQSHMLQQDNRDEDNDDDEEDDDSDDDDKLTTMPRSRLT